MSLKLNACCCCVPLRIGLLVWGYTGLFLCYVSILQSLFRICDILDGSEKSDASTFMYLTLATGASVVHFVFYIFLVAGLHKRSCTLLEIFYGYNVIVMIISAALMALYIPLKVYKLYPVYGMGVCWLVVLFVGIAASIVLLQFYLGISVRSVICKLEEELECTPLDPEELDTCVLRDFHLNKEKC